MVRKSKIICLMAGAALFSVAFTGCRGKEHYEKPKTAIEEYQPWTYDAVEVVRGDIEPSVELKLKGTESETKTYHSLLDEMEVESVNVSEGDTVSEGTVMVTFKSGDLGDKIDQYKTRLEEDELLIEHYTRLAEIDKTTDYSENIRLVRDDMGVCSLYIQELEARLEEYNIVAEGDGIITGVSQILDYGVVGSQDGLVSVKYGTGEFVASTEEDFDFKEGDVFEATYANTIIDIQLIKMEAGGESEDGSVEHKLYFKALGDIGSVVSYDTLYLSVNKKVIKDVLYVPEEALFQVDEKYYVYVMDDRNMRHGAEVTIGDTENGYTVIKSGLTEGDKVVIN
ncbi:MAG: efflux RND transporter periplasmic adaptor subunit [Clostridium sp.]|nr:efflux RND transporter periplasmic adaptor subunit [Clostridium sp.]